MFLVLTGMPVTVQAADYDGGTGSAEKTQETYLKTFLEDLDFAELDTWTKEELFPEQREKFSFSVMVQELLADGIGVTSMEKIAEVTGVPNRAEKAALMPHMVKMRASFSSRCKILPNFAARLPPSCNAAPSLPADPPKRWVKSVVAKISGAVLNESFSFVRTGINTKFVPRSLLIPPHLYSAVIKTPPTGKSQTSHGCACRNASAPLKAM